MLNVLPALILLLMQGPALSDSQAQSLRMALYLATRQEAQIRTVDAAESGADEFDSSDDLDAALTLDLLNADPSWLPWAWLVDDRPATPQLPFAAEIQPESSALGEPQSPGLLPEGRQTGGRLRDGPARLAGA
ncbi:MAG TPA: hypothetical protein PLO61_04960 [Fimbriimonadaceae bacterium]|nr:hypothetical protein [Fimbriimonadaceae bacterium]HRJ32569.1 hypothetical protein [Fimbriimonadaceae bacterium]